LPSCTNKDLIELFNRLIGCFILSSVSQVQEKSNIMKQLNILLGDKANLKALFAPALWGAICPYNSIIFPQYFSNYFQSSHKDMVYYKYIIRFLYYKLMSTKS
jgi:hypothetical protein